MTPTAPITAPKRTGGPPSRSLAGGLGFTQNIEDAFERSANGKVRAKIVPERILDVPYYANVAVPTAGGTNVSNLQTSLEADLTRGALEFLMEDTGLKEIEVLGPAETAGGGGGGGNGGGGNGNTDPGPTKTGFFGRNWPWILGGGAALVVGVQLLARSGRRRVARARPTGGRSMEGRPTGQPATQGSRSNPNGDSPGPVDEAEETIEELEEETEESIPTPLKEKGSDSPDPVEAEEFTDEVTEATEAAEMAMEELEEETEEALPEFLMERGNPSDSSGDGSPSGDGPDYWIARAPVDKDEMDRGNVHRTSMASNISSLDMEDQRRIASNLAVAPGGKVTVHENTPEGLKERKTFRWRPDNGFSPTG